VLIQKIKATNEMEKGMGGTTSGPDWQVVQTFKLNEKDKSLTGLETPKRTKTKRWKNSLC